jgi:hypothetical protein
MQRLLPLLGLFALAASAASAEEPDAAPADEWRFAFAPYLWAAGLEGTVDAERVSADVDVPFSDIWDALDVGVLGAFEARRGKLSLVSNLIYLKLSADAENPVSPLLPAAPPGSFTVRSLTEEVILELRPTWEVLSLAPFGDERRVALDLGPAARVFWLDSHLHVALRPGVPVGPFSRRFDETTDWVDFLAAARVRAALTEEIGLVVAGDYGGFDIGSSSHRTWSLWGYFSYRLGQHWDVTLGWRTLEFERDAVDLEMAGPLVGAVCRF